MTKRNSSEPATRPGRLVSWVRRHQDLAGVVVIVLTAGLAYFPALHGGFILDDDILLVDSPLIRASDGLYRFWCTTEAIDYWPLSNSMLWLEWRLWGMHSTGYHVTSLVLHIVEAGLIWAILRRISIPGAFLAALLFAVHPVNVESVAWISQRKNLLALLFFLLSIFWYLKAETQSSPQLSRTLPLADRWYALSLLAFVLAVLSKGSVAILPPILLGIGWWMRPLTRRDLVRVMPFFLVSVVLVPVNVWFQARLIRSEFPTFSLAERLLGAGNAVWFYLSKALVPIKLAFIYPQWHIHVDQWRWWLPLLGALATTCVLWWYRQGWSRPLLFAWGYFCVALVPVLGFADVGFMQHSLVADHYQHVALIGVVALVAAGWDTWRKRMQGPARWVPYAAAAAVGSALVVLTWQQSGLYADSMTLFQDTLTKNPDSWMTHNNLGAVLLQAGRPQEAIEQCEQAVRLKPNYPEAHHNLGNALRAAGWLPEAIEHYQQALQLKPSFPEAHDSLGAALADAGRLQEAVAQHEQALRLKPGFAEAHNNLGNALLQTGRPQEAIAHYEAALRLKPGFAEAHNNIGSVLARAGRFQEAIAQFKQALSLKPDYPDAQYNLRAATTMQQQAADGGRTMGDKLTLP